MAITWRLDAVLEDRGITAYQLAQLTGLTVPACYNLVKQNPNRRVPLATLEQLCDALECTPADLFAYRKGD